MTKGTKYLILKFGEGQIRDTMQKHMDVIANEEYCWFGKMGRPFSSKAVGILNETKSLFMYVRGHVYYGEYEEISNEVKKDHVPDYYFTEFYEYLEYPSVYLKLTHLREVDSKILEELFVDTTKKTVAEGILRCMNPTIFATALVDKTL